MALYFYQRTNLYTFNTHSVIQCQPIRAGCGSLGNGNNNGIGVGSVGGGGGAPLGELRSPWPPAAPAGVRRESDASATAVAAADGEVRRCRLTSG